MSLMAPAAPNDSASKSADVRADTRAAITRLYRADESACVQALLAEVDALHLDQHAIAQRAADLVRQVRQAQRSTGGIDHLMREFSLSSQEGVALMCLAEALLRIPDAATRDRLIRDKVSRGDWNAHLGANRSLFVNAATWGLMLTGRLLATRREDSLASALVRALAHGGEPLIRRSVEFVMTLLGRQFVMGETIEEALGRSRDNIGKGYTHSFDMLGEAALTGTDAERYTLAYAEAIHAIGKSGTGGVIDGSGISVKLSALHPRYCRAQRDRVMTELYPRLAELAGLAADYGLGFNIDAEEADRLDLSLDLVGRLAGEPNLKAGWQGLGVVVQAYQKRCPAVIDHLVRLARDQRTQLMVRLVKGAYWDSEIKRAQVDGLDGYPVFTRKPHSDLSYLACASRLLAASDVIYPQFATHNAHTLAAVERLALARQVTRYEFQCLHGMGETLYDHVVSSGEPHRRCRIYAPVGRHETLLPYLVRRLLENGANTSFVNRIADASVSVEDLVTDPAEQTRNAGATPHPRIPLPRDLFAPQRANSRGVDFSNEHELADIGRQLEQMQAHRWTAEPLVAGQAGGRGEALDVRNPADTADLVGQVIDASTDDVRSALAAAADAGMAWQQVPPSKRAAHLRGAAERLEARRYDLMSLCVREAGKTWSNAIAEIREAVDFCRYYANRIDALPAVAAPPGVALCISPWNFPLAIFVGQITAALAAGRPVIAKPAEQTPLIAAYAVRLLHEAGVPLAALQFLPGPGETIGAALTADARVRAVLFTGSTEVAQRINRALANHPAAQPQPILIAETGGQNAMVVDSSAHTEQVVQDVLVSGFDSAGQRCSALRVLCLQEEIADRVLDMLRAAMRELRIGNPAKLATDVGPVIDAPAQQALLAHIAAMRQRGHAIHQCPLPAECAAGTFVPPTLIEIDELAELDREVFGPVVHVVRYAADQRPALIDAINATGYGLTFGLHSRIDEAIEQTAAAIQAGNLYVNRNMVGAVVGVQPFGGMGKSGTGPKAGGPFYLSRLAGGSPPLQALGKLERDDSDSPAAQRLARFATWAGRQGMADLVETCATYAAATLLNCRIRLPGPTGEENTLAFQPRGHVACAAQTLPALLTQLAAVLATGNTPVVLDGSPPLPKSLPADIADLVRWAGSLNDIPCAAVLADLPDAALSALRRAAAQLDGALLPVIGAEAATGPYPPYRLMHEQVVSINTTAAGGNTTLITLAA